MEGKAWILEHRPGTSIKVEMVEMTNRAHVTCDAGAFDD